MSKEAVETELGNIVYQAERELARYYVARFVEIC